MKRKIKSKDGKYRMTHRLELRDILLVLTIIGVVVLIAYFCEV